MNINSLEEVLKKHFDELKRKCSSCILNTSFKLNDLIFIECFYNGNQYGDFPNLKLSSVPNQFKYENVKYFFKFLVSFISPATPKGIGHFKTIFQDSDKFIEYNDLFSTPVLTFSSTEINPKFLVYSK